MLRKLRITLSLTMATMLTLNLVDISNVMPSWFSQIARFQFLPALLSLNLFAIIFLALLTFVFGRVYCSSICPFGLYQDVVSWLSKKINKKKRFRFSKALTAMRWVFVSITLTAFLSGFTVLLGLLDPYSIYSRFAVHILKPGYALGNNLASLIFSSFENQSFTKVSIYLLSLSSLIIAISTSVIVGYLAWMNGRVYCNTVCPVGTVLGLISKASLLKIRINESLCNSCGACGRNCKATCINTKEHKIDYSRCINCFDCLEVCSKSAINYNYSFRLPVKNSKKAVNASRRRFMMALGVSGLAASKLLADKLPQVGDSKKIARKAPITPPGSKSAENLLQKCTSCHLCVSKCPTNIIKPAFLQYGIAGMMQPTLSFENDYCTYECTVCSNVCPSGALLPLTVEQKTTNQLGEVQFVLTNCIVFTDNEDCGKCASFCPTKAVYMVDYKNGLSIPEVNTTLCVGCGACECNCPATPYKAIHVEGVKQHKTIKFPKKVVEKAATDDFDF